MKRFNAVGLPFNPQQPTYLMDPTTQYVWAKPAWAARIDPNARMVLVSSGRGGGGKSLFFGWYMLKWACERPRSILVAAREVLKDLSESSQQVFKHWIGHPAAPWDASFFRIRGSRIELANGSIIYFRGLSSSSGTSYRIKSMEGLDAVWVDEAQSLSKESVDTLLPTVRKRGSKIFMSYNPHLPTDPVAQMAAQAQDTDRIQHLHLSYTDNPWFKSSEMEAERLHDQRYKPEMYAHIWEGEFHNADPYCLVPYHETLMCQREWPQDAIDAASQSFYDAGYDIAVSEKGDHNAYAQRTGGVLTRLERWMGTTFKVSCERLRHYNRPSSHTLYFDQGGVGRGFGDELEADPDYETNLRPVNFGGAVKGKQVRYMPDVTNEAFFARRNSQLYWGLRLRIKNTVRHLAGEDVPLSTCLLIPPDVPQTLVQTLAAQASTATYEHSKAGKLETIKMPKGGDSPDLLDAVALAFAYDSASGLREGLGTATFQEAIPI